MRITEAYNLPFKQTQLDFVNVRSDRDVPVFIDPFALRKETEPWLADAREYLQSYFQALLAAIGQKRTDDAFELLEGLHEPHEARLGYSKTSKGGRGVGRTQAEQLIHTISRSQAARSGLIEDISESELLIDGFSHDKISDITTNVLRWHLAEYTHQQCKTFGIPTESIPLDRLWNPQTLEWGEDYRQLPLLNGSPVLLVPKILVRLAPSISSEDYYNRYVIEFYRANKQAAARRLAGALKHKPKKVTKKETKGDHPYSKKLLFEFSQSNPSIYRDYIARAEIESKPISLATWAEIASEGVKEAFDGCKDLRDTTAGTADADRFHLAVMKCLTVIFEPTLFSPKKEYTTYSDTKRVDITYRNRQDQGFFKHLGQAYSIRCPNVFVECKNYSSDPSNPEVDQLAGRMSTTLGQFGILVCRQVDDPDKLCKRMKATHSNQGHWMMYLTIERICELLALKQSGGEAAILNRMIFWAEESVK